MNLSSMLNDGPGPEKKAPPPAPSPSTVGVDGHPPNPTPPYATSSGPGSMSSQIRGITPLRTSSQHPGGGPYSYPAPHQPQHLSQSPGPVHPGQQYPPQPPYTATTPGPKAPGHTYQHSHPSPSRFQPSSIPQGLQHAQHPQHTSSVSPTPPSYHSPTAHSVRQSPLTAMPGQPSMPMQQPQPQYQQSQPSTPLGPPPPLQYHRSSGQSYHEAQSPYHSRTMSGASNGVVSGSPAQHHPNIGNLVDSPNRPPSHTRRTSEYLSQLDRERSVSVSPKTKVPPRRPSIGSRHSSHNTQSSRSSVQPNSGEHHSYAQPHAPPGVAHAQHPPSHVAQYSPLTSNHSQPLVVNPGPQVDPQLSHATIQPPIHHQPQRIDMNHLLTPASEYPTPANDTTMPNQPPNRKENSGIFMKPSPKPKKPAVAAPPAAQLNDPQPGSHVRHQSPAQQQQNKFVDRSSEADTNADAQPKPTAKRAAETEPSAEPPSKRGKMRKYAERPVWAQLARNNPRFTELQNGQGKGQPPQNQPPHSRAQSISTGQAHPNGQQHVNGGAPDPHPWLQNPPLDQDLLHTRRVLGPWEKTARWNTPYPDLLKAVQDWLFSQLSALGEIGNNPQEGTIEIEAKIGQILKKGTDDRLQIPVLNAVVLAPQISDQIRFESQMDERAFQAMNKYLNDTLVASHKPGRVKMIYDHPKETDSFRTLSSMGYQALPPAFQRQKRGRDLKLRTTTKADGGAVKARIVKIGVADLHIYNPTGEYDCRISINLEMNMMRPDLHPNDITEEPTPDKPLPPSREKDRLSYKHLAYSFDLTQVKVPHMQAKYELELEVNAATLREQMRLMLNGEPDAFGDVVSGFVDNATFLMRQKPE